MSVDRAFAVLYCDLDNFKAYNDQKGFVRGDRLIQATARIIQDAVAEFAGPEGFVGHVGGDDFVAITPPDVAEDTAKRLFAHPEKARGFAPLDPAIEAKEQALVRRLTGGMHDAEAERRLGEIPCATLVLFGSEDKIVAPEAARTYRARIPNSNIAFVYDAGHLIEAERPEALVNAVSDYVELRETFIVGRQTGIINP